MAVTAEKIAEALYASQKGVTPERVRKAHARAEQYKVTWDAVEALAQRFTVVPEPNPKTRRKRQIPEFSRGD